MMNKLFLLILAAGLVLTACGSAPTAAPIAVPSPTPVPPAEPFTLTVTAGTEIGQTPEYTASTEIPVLAGAAGVQVAPFNADLEIIIHAQVADFKKAVQDLALVPGPAGSYFDQRLTQVSHVADMVSLKLVTEIYIAGAAHPSHQSVSYNLNLATGRVLGLGDLFLPGSNYLQTIADYCKAQLVARQLTADIFGQGADPTPENYQVWNLNADGLLITFNEYQVGPYAIGPQLITVPYADVQSVIDPQGPLASFLP